MGAIIVGIAVAVGISLFRSSAIDAARDALASDLNDLAARAQAYYKKPRSLSGGERTYTDANNEVITIYTLTSVPQNQNGTYFIDSDSSSAQELIIVGQGFEIVGDVPVEVRIRVTPNEITLIPVN